MMMDQMTLPPLTLRSCGAYPTMENSTTSLSLAGMEKFPLASDWVAFWVVLLVTVTDPDRKSTRLNSSHQIISYAVFCLKKKKTKKNLTNMKHENEKSSRAVTN